MRLLHARHDHVSPCAARRQSAAIGGRDQATHERQHLPLRNLPAHSRGDSSRRRRSQKVMKEIDLNEAELHAQTVEPLRHLFDMNRRELFKFLGAGLVVGVCARTGLAQESGRAQGEAIPQDLDSWLHIAGDGKITVLTGKVEMGQNIRTSLAQQLAEELRGPMDSITMIMGDTDLTPFDMGTFGSRTTPQMGSQLRNVSVQAREMLVDLAARHWSVDRGVLTAQNGAIVNSRNGQKISYGELTKGQKLVKVLDDDPALTPATEWHIAGKPATKVDGKAFVTGSHQYTSDITRPGMLYGKVLRPSALNATLVSVDTKAVEEKQIPPSTQNGNIK